MQRAHQSYPILKVVLTSRKPTEPWKAADPAGNIGLAGHWRVSGPKPATPIAGFWTADVAVRRAKNYA